MSVRPSPAPSPASVMNRGKRFSSPRLVLFLQPGAGTFAAVAGRRVGNAVARNRARRILRAAWREAASEVQETTDIVLLARPTISGASSLDLVPEIRELLLRASAGATA